MTKKTTYAVQWHDGDKWRTSTGYRANTLEQAESELDMHRSTYPHVDVRLVKLEVTTTVHPLTITDPKDD
jgi:hypothetical protein